MSNAEQHYDPAGASSPDQPEAPQQPAVPQPPLAPPAAPGPPAPSAPPAPSVPGQPGGYGGQAGHYGQAGQYGQQALPAYPQPTSPYAAAGQQPDQSLYPQQYGGPTYAQQPYQMPGYAPSLAQPAFAAQPYATFPVYVTPSQPKGLSPMSMIFGLVSILFGFTFLLPLAGLVLGILGLKREPAARGMAITGIVLNGIFIVGWALLIGILIWVTGAFWVAGTSGSSYSSYS